MIIFGYEITRCPNKLDVLRDKLYSDHSRTSRKLQDLEYRLDKFMTYCEAVHKENEVKVPDRFRGTDPYSRTDRAMNRGMT